MRVGLKQLSRSEGFLSELVRLDSFPDGWLLFLGGVEIAGMLWKSEGGHAAPECNKLRPHHLLSRGVCYLLF